MDTGIDLILEKRAVKTAEKKAKEAELEASRADNYIVYEKNPAGLYTCRYALGGPVPNELKTKFTSRTKILAICKQRGIKVKE
jgi:hypothetical protein